MGDQGSWINRKISFKYKAIMVYEEKAFDNDIIKKGFI